MPTGDADDLRRDFDALLSGSDLGDLRELAGHLSLIAGDDSAQRASNPHLRHAHRSEPAIFGVRVDLNDAHPPIWRRLDLRSDLTLDAVHQILQTAFDWHDGHLHRFSIGGGPFDRSAEWFLCEYDAEEGEDEGTPDIEITLDETLAKVGDALHYVYDYGDDWDLTIRLEEIRPLADDARQATCVDGRRAAPPDDCGGLREADDLVDVLDDPDSFDLDALNARLVSPVGVLAEWGVRPDLVSLLDRLKRSPTGDFFVGATLAVAHSVPEADVLAANLGAYQWFLDRAVDGIPLTAAGYLKPVDVEAASAVVSTVGDWIGKKNREDLTYPLLEFRQSLHRIGLLRKYKGNLLLTKDGKRAQSCPTVLWEHLRHHLLDVTGDPFETQARLLALLCLASEPDGRHEHRIAEALTYLGWSQREGHPVSVETGRWAVREVTGTLANVADVQRDRSIPRAERRRLSPCAVLMARGILAVQ